MTELLLHEIRTLKTQIADIHKLLFNVEPNAPKEELYNRLKAEILMGTSKSRKQYSY